MSAAGRTPKPGARNCDSGCGCGGGHDGLIQAEHGASKPPPTASHKLAPRWRPTLRLCSIYKRNSSNFLLRHTGQCCPSLTGVMMPERPFLGPWFADPLANPRKLDVRSSYRISLLDRTRKPVPGLVYEGILRASRRSSVHRRMADSWQQAV